MLCRRAGMNRQQALFWSCSGVQRAIFPASAENLIFHTPSRVLCPRLLLYCAQLSSVAKPLDESEQQFSRHTLRACLRKFVWPQPPQLAPSKTHPPTHKPQLLRRTYPPARRLQASRRVFFGSYIRCEVLSSWLGGLCAGRRLVSTESTSKRFPIRDLCSLVHRVIRYGEGRFVPLSGHRKTSALA